MKQMDRTDHVVGDRGWVCEVHHPSWSTFFVCLKFSTMNYKEKTSTSIQINGGINHYTLPRLVRSHLLLYSALL